MRAQDRIQATLDSVNAQNATRDLTDRVWATDTSLFEGLFFVSELLDQLTEQVARLEKLQGPAAQSVDGGARLSDVPQEIDWLTGRVARLEQLQGSAAQSADVEAKQHDTRKEIDDSRKEIDDIRSDVHRLTQELARLDAREWDTQLMEVRAPLKELQSMFWSMFWTVGETDDLVGLEQWAHEILPVADEMTKWVDAHPCPDASRAAMVSQMEKDTALWGDVAKTILDRSIPSGDRIAHVSESLTEVLARRVARLGS